MKTEEEVVQLLINILREYADRNRKWAQAKSFDHPQPGLTLTIGTSEYYIVVVKSR